LVLLQEAIFEKRYALVGFSAGVILLALAVTSTRGWMKRMGKTWAKLHKFVYLAGILVIVHYVWLVKTDIRQPILFGTILLLLLLARIPYVRRQLSRVRQHKIIRKFQAMQELFKNKNGLIPYKKVVSGEKNPG